MELTLKDIPRKGLTAEDVRHINLNLLLLLQLNSLCLNLVNEIRDIYKERGEYKLNIKHYHKQIKDLILQNYNGRCWEKFTLEQIEVIGEDADSLEELVLAWANNTMPDWIEKYMIKQDEKLSGDVEDKGRQS